MCAKHFCVSSWGTGQPQLAEWRLQGPACFWGAWRRGQGPSPATGWEGLKQVGAATIRKAIGPQGGPSQVLGMGAQGWESEEEGPPGGTLVFLEHLGVRLLPQCAGSQGAGMVTEAGAPAPAHS